MLFSGPGVRIESNNNEDLLPSGNEEDLEGEDQDGPRPSAQPSYANSV